MFELIEKMKANPKLQDLNKGDAVVEHILPVLEVLGQEVRDALNNQECVTLIGLGQLLPLADKRTPDKRIVRFRASNILKSSLNPTDRIPATNGDQR